MRSDRFVLGSLLVAVVTGCAGAAPTAAPPTPPPTATSAPVTVAPPVTPGATTTGAPATGTPAASEAPATPGAGGALTIGLFQEPDNLNPYTAVQTASRIVRQMALEGLVTADPNGNYIPQLAAQVPSVENGGISKDGLTITYKLLTGVKWSDGDPFSSADVKFTWQAIMDPVNKVNSRGGYDQISSVDTPDDSTVVVTFKTLYAAALSLFSITGAVLPAHAFQGTTMENSPFNRTPEGTGPFVISEWNSGQSIVLDANKNYRVAGKPLLSRIVFSIIADQQAGITQLRAGDTQALWNLDESTASGLQGVTGIDIEAVPSSNVEYLGLNLSKRGAADPTVPHPVLADPAVRQAIASAIDRTPIVQDLLGGRSEVATSPIGLGWAAPQGLSLPAYDPEAAKTLLEGAGWKDADGDGIREKNGVKASLEISTPSGQTVRDQTEQLLQEQLLAVGIELKINNVTAQTLFATWGENGKLKRGDFDIVEDTWGADLDPDAFVSQLFASDQIPTAANDGAGWNFFRLKDTKLDQLIAQGRSTLDQAARAATYRKVAQRITEDLVYIPLYKRSVINAFGSQVQGEAPNPWMEMTWNTQDWTLGG